MTREQKVKAYLENLGKAKDLLEQISTELKESEESEDKKIIQFFTELATNACGGPGQEYYEELGLNYNKVMDWLEKQKYDRMKPIYDAKESFESALEKAWNDYHNGYENVDKLEDDYVECAHAKGFREGYLFGIEKQKEPKNVSASTMIPSCWEEEQKDKPHWKPSEEQIEELNKARTLNPGLDALYQQLKNM